MTFWWRAFDWGIFAALMLLAGASLISLASSNPQFFSRQLIWYMAAFLIVGFGSVIPWRWLISHLWFRYGVYGIGIALLIATNLQSQVIRGTKSWLVIGGFQFEPSEIVKFALIILFAHFFSRRHLVAWQMKPLLISFSLTLLPMVLVLRQPNLGGAVTIAALWIGYLLIGGIHKKRFFIGLCLALIAGALLWFLELAPYQKERIIAFFSPAYDPLGINYNAIQAKIAIGSAGFFGKGFGNGTQANLHFLPETYSDFLFAAFVEEWGVMGGFVLLLTFLFLLFKIIKIGVRANDNYSKMIVWGGALFFAVHFFINVGSNVGLLPVTGITFPFFSYGGSNLLTAAFLLGIIEHIKVGSYS